jgi:hypothetical protein
MCVLQTKVFKDLQTRSDDRVAICVGNQRFDPALRKLHLQLNKISMPFQKSILKIKPSLSLKHFYSAVSKQNA